MRYINVTVLQFLLFINVAQSQIYETPLTSNGNILDVCFAPNQNIYLLTRDGGDLNLSAITPNKQHQQLFSWPAGQQYFQKMVALDANRLAIVSAKYDTIFQMPSDRFLPNFARSWAVIDVVNSSNKQIDTSLSFVMLDTVCTNIFRAAASRPLIKILASDSSLHLSQYFHNHEIVDSVNRTPMYLTLAKVNKKLDLVYKKQQMHDTNYGTSAQSILLNRFFDQTGEVINVVQTNFNSGKSAVKVNRIDDLGNIKVLNVIPEATKFHDEKHFHLQYPNIFFYKNTQEDRSILRMRRDPTWDPEETEVLSKVVVFVSPKNQEGVSFDEYPMSFTQSHMLYLTQDRDFTNDQYSQFIITDTLLNMKLQMFSKKIGFITLHVVPLSGDSFVVVGDFINRFTNDTYRHSYLITSSRFPDHTGIKRMGANKDAISFSPNPASQSLHIHGADYSRLLFINAIGASTQLTTIAPNVFDVQQLKNGLYMVRDEEGNYLGKVLVSH
jgi:hypothetical protein